MAAIRRRQARFEALQQLKSWLDASAGAPLALGGLHPADVADVMWLDLEEEDARRLFRALPEAEAAAVLEETEPRFQAALLDGAEPSLIGRLLGRLPPDDATDVLEQLPEQIRLEAMCFVKPEDAAELRHLAEYDPDTAGGMMTTEFLTARADEKVGDVLKRIKRDEGEAETVYSIYVTDPKDVLLGVASTRELLEAGIHQEVGEILNPDVIQVKSDEDREDVARPASSPPTTRSKSSSRRAPRTRCCSPAPAASPTSATRCTSRCCAGRRCSRCRWPPACSSPNWSISSPAKPARRVPAANGAFCFPSFRSCSRWPAPSACRRRQCWCAASRSARSPPAAARKCSSPKCASACCSACSQGSSPVR
jgi:hypothetical protein